MFALSCGLQEMENNLVSVIVPTYNTGLPLRDCLESILSQTYKELEVVITDDNSSDSVTIGILREFQQRDARVRVFWLKDNGGPGVARNNSIQEARGRYIAFCDSDDAWFPDKLEKQMAFMKANDCCLTFTSYIVCDNNGMGTGIVNCPKRVSFRMLKKDNKVGCLTAVYDVSKHGKFYLPSLRKRQDWAMFLKMLRECGYGYGIQEPLAYYRKRKKSVSRNKLSLVKYNIKVYNDVLGFSRVKSYLYFLFLFLPTYYAKITRVRWDSWVYVRRKGEAIDKIKNTASDTIKYRE